MLIHIRSVDDDLVAKAKAATGKGSASQAFIAGVEKMLQQTSTIASLEEDNRRLRESLQRSQRLLAQLAPLCVQVAELAGQKDLFD